MTSGIDPAVVEMMGNPTAIASIKTSDQSPRSTTKWLIERSKHIDSISESTI
jgi:hypothetical protein